MEEMYWRRPKITLHPRQEEGTTELRLRTRNKVYSRKKTVLRKELK